VSNQVETGVNSKANLEVIMNTSLKQIEEQALSLSAEERAKLADVILESLATPLADIEAAWAEEIEQRVAAYDRGDIPSYPAEDVFAEAKRIQK
jgi:putative addiction module component (TIGR02574 family)